MKQFLDYIPLLVFFSVWATDERDISLFGYTREFGGIYSAAEVLIIASVLVYGGLFLRQRRLDKFQWVTLCAVILFCIPTILFRNVDFLKWKAPIVNWIFAAVFFASRYIGSKPAIEHLMGHAVQAPAAVWLRLNNLWIIWFVALGLINLIVAFTLSEALWIQFKVFGNLILTVLFILFQMPMLARHIQQ
ncbi:MAG: inner membrane-spanning protein YciB [Pseudohongiellaceae bacterium]